MRLTLFAFRALALWASIQVVWPQTNPVKMSNSGRFDLRAGSSVGSINQGVFLKGAGSVDRMNWIAEADQPLSYTCHPLAIHFGWTKVQFSFVPERDGTVDLTLMGPWQPSPNDGPIYRQEVAWDLLSATGTTVVGGGFERVRNSLPIGWTQPYGDATLVEAPFTPVEGIRYMVTWHDGPLRQTLPVTGGVPVVLTFNVRAVVPEGFIDMERVPGTDTPAHRMALKFMRGANLGNYLEAPAGQSWGVTYSEQDFVNIRAEGFDHVRIPIRWNDHTGPAPEFTIDSNFRSKVDFLVTNAVNHGLGALVNIHHFDDFTTDPGAQTPKFLAIWKQIAEHYQSQPDTVVFELLNEPKDAATTEVLNPIYEQAIHVIRESNPARTIFAGPSQWNSVDELVNLRLPATEQNVIVTVHSYAPFLFTHQGASWTGDEDSTTGVVYPGPPASPITPAPAAAAHSWVVDWFDRYNVLPAELNPCGPQAFVPTLELAKQWSAYYGRPVHLGEYGAYSVADSASRARFYADMRATLDRLGLGWAVWDWKAGFRYWDSNSGQPAEGMPKALFPEIQLRSEAPGHLDFESAAGKRFNIWKWDALGSRSNRQIRDTIVLETPHFHFEDDTANDLHGFYQVEWLK